MCGWLRRVTMAASRAVRISLDWSARSLSARLWWPSSVEPRGMILHATLSGDSLVLCVGVRGRRLRLTCSGPSSLRANLTLPILPAPMVLPRIHLPEDVGMVVRLLLGLLEDEAWCRPSDGA